MGGLFSSTRGIKWENIGTLGALGSAQSIRFGFLRLRKLVIDAIHIRILDDCIQRFENPVLKQRGADPIGKIMQLVECSLELGRAILIRVIHAKHADQHLFEHRRFAICGRNVLAQVPRFDMEPRQLGAVANDIEISAIDELAILRAANDANQIIIR